MANSNDKWLGLMSVVMLGSTIAAAYFGWSSAYHRKLKTDADSTAKQLEKDISQQRLSIEKQDNKLALLESKTETQKEELAAKEIEYQQLTEAYERKHGHAAKDLQRLEIAERNVTDLQRRNREIESLVNQMKDRLGVSSSEELLAQIDSIQQIASTSDVSDNAQGDKREIAETNDRQPTDPLTNSDDTNNADPIINNIAVEEDAAKNLAANDPIARFQLERARLERARQEQDRRNNVRLNANDQNNNNVAHANLLQDNNQADNALINHDQERSEQERRDLLAWFFDQKNARAVANTNHSDTPNGNQKHDSSAANENGPDKSAVSVSKGWPDNVTLKPTSEKTNQFGSEIVSELESQLEEAMRRLDKRDRMLREQAELIERLKKSNVREQAVNKPPYDSETEQSESGTVIIEYPAEEISDSEIPYEVEYEYGDASEVEYGEYVETDAVVPVNSGFQSNRSTSPR